MADPAFHTPLVHEGILAVRGPDAAKFLQGQLTCNLAYLNDETSSLGGRCNIKGRLLSSFRILPEGDGLLLAMAGELLEAQLADLKKYAVFSKASLADESAAWLRIGLRDASEALRALGIDTPAESGRIARHGDLLAVALGDARVERDYRSYASTLSLEQPLFDYEAYARYRQGEAQALFADEQFRGRSQELAVRLFAAYSETLFAREQVVLAEAQRRALETQLAFNQRAFEEGEGTRTDLLEILPGETAKQQNLDLAPLLGSELIPADKPQFCEVEKNPPFDQGLLAEKMVELSKAAIEGLSGGEYELDICNCDRSIGARVSGEIARLHGNQGMAKAPVVFRFKGTAGQSFGVWNAGGLHLYLEGDANDYVGKGMTGGKLVITPPKGSPFKTQESAIVGNTCLYGATGGKLFAAGTAGERFAVRNSGSHAVVEGTGDHCCEYMTGGFVCVLGKTGYNFGSGMTGGFAYVLDMDNTFVDRVNHELVEIQRISGEAMEAYRSHLRKVLVEYVNETASEWGANILENLDDYLRRFWLVKPKAASLGSLLTSTRANPQ